MLVTFYRPSKFNSFINDSEGANNSFDKTIERNDEDHLQESHSPLIDSEKYFNAFHYHYRIDFDEQDLDLFVNVYLNKSSLSTEGKENYYEHALCSAFCLFHNPGAQKLAFQSGGYVYRGGK